MSDTTVTRAKVLDGVCPFCDAGPFKVVAMHTTRVHDVGRYELRRLCDLSSKASICDPQYSQDCAERAKQRIDDAADGFGPHPEFLPEVVRPISPEARRRAAETLRKRRRAETADRDAAILDLYERGLTLEDIADRMDLWPKSVTRILRRHGIGDDGRSRDAAKPPKGWFPEAAHEAFRRKRAAERADLAKAFKGGVSVYDLASREGVTVKSMRARLRRAGVDVPDGRADPLRPKRTNYPTAKKGDAVAED